MRESRHAAERTAAGRLEAQIRRHDANGASGVPKTAPIASSTGGTVREVTAAVENEILSGGGGFVLLVEDNADDEYLLRRAYRKARLSWKLVAVDRGAEALDLVVTCGCAPRCVLLGTRLARPDAIALLGTLRGLAPVIVLAASESEAAFYLAQPGVAVVRKTVSPEALAAAMNDVLLRAAS